MDRKSRKSVFLVAVSILTAWLLMSSIQMIDFSNAKLGATDLNGFGSGFNFGNGYGFGGGSGISFTFPSMNLNLGNFSLGIPDFNLNFHVPPLNFSFLRSPRPPGNNQTTLNETVYNQTKNGTSPPPSSGGNHGYQVFSMPLNQIVLVLVILAAAAMAAYGAFRLRKGKRGTPEKNEYEEKQDPIDPDLPTGERGEKHGGIVRKLSGGSLKGWGGSRLFKTEVPEDIPLTWEVGSALPIIPENGTIMDAGTATVVGSPGTGVVASEVCTPITFRSGELSESFVLRSAKYSDDVIQSMRMNFGDLDGMNARTARELIPDLVSSGASIDSKELEAAVRDFERVLYGRKEIDRHEYYSFLRSLRGGFRSPTVPVCGNRK